MDKTIGKVPGRRSFRPGIRPAGADTNYEDSSTDMTTIDIANAYAARHNTGVDTGNFAPMLDLFAEKAELHFASIPFGPFIGRAAIGAAFAAHPPGDHLVLLTVTDSEGSSGSAKVHAVYGWRSAPTVPDGTIDGVIENGLITRWTITFTPEASR